MTTAVRNKNALEFELSSITRDMKSISPRTSTYAKLAQRRKEIYKALAPAKESVRENGPGNTDSKDEGEEAPGRDRSGGADGVS